MPQQKICHIYHVDVLETINETGNERDSNDNCFSTCDLDDTIKDVETSRSRYILVEEDGIDQDGDEEEKYVFLQVGDTVDPYLVRNPKVPDDWVIHFSNKNKGEPHLSGVDNPGRWSRFYCWPEF